MIIIYWNIYTYIYVYIYIHFFGGMYMHSIDFIWLWTRIWYTHYDIARTKQDMTWYPPISYISFSSLGCIYLCQSCRPFPSRLDWGTTNPPWASAQHNVGAFGCHALLALPHILHQLYPRRWVRWVAIDSIDLKTTRCHGGKQWKEQWQWENVWKFRNAIVAVVPWFKTVFGRCWLFFFSRSWFKRMAILKSLTLMSVVLLFQAELDIILYLHIFNTVPLLKFSSYLMGHVGPTYRLFALQKWRQFLGPSWSSPKACGRVPLRIKSSLLAFPQTTPQRPRVWHTMPFGWYWSSSFGPLKARVRSFQIWYWKKKLERWHFWTMTICIYIYTYNYTVHSCDSLKESDGHPSSLVEFGSFCKFTLSSTHLKATHRSRVPLIMMTSPYLTVKEAVQTPNPWTMRNHRPWQHMPA